MKEDIEKKLQKYYLTLMPKQNTVGMEKIIDEAGRMKEKAVDKTISFWGFFFSQFRFIRIKTWSIQFILLLLIGFKFWQGGEQRIFLACLSAVSPILLLSGIQEIFRSRIYDTQEMEFSTMYTGKHVILTRFCIIGGVDIISLSIYCILARVRLLYPGYMVFLYTLVPFLVTCFGCLWIMNDLKQSEALHYCYGYGVCVAGVTAVLALYFPYFYMISSLWIWGIVLGITMIGIIKELSVWYKSLEKAEKYMKMGENTWK